MTLSNVIPLLSILLSTSLTQGGITFSAPEGSRTPTSVPLTLFVNQLQNNSNPRDALIVIQNLSAEQAAAQDNEIRKKIKKELRQEQQRQLAFQPR